MTPELQERLQQALPPFDGSGIHNTDDLSLSQLRGLLNQIVETLKCRDPEIRKFHDWHEHDGFIDSWKKVSWDSVLAGIATNRALFDSRDGDFAVRIAIYPPTYDWLLRYNVDDEDLSDFNTATCDFDLSVAKGVDITGLFDSPIVFYPNMIARHESQPWFQSRCGG